MIEFVIVMPVLIFFVMAIMQLALVATANIMTNYAAFSAARSYSVHQDEDKAKLAARIVLMPISSPSPRREGIGLNSIISEILEKIPVPEFMQEVRTMARRYMYAADNTTVSHLGSTTIVKYNFQLDMPMVGRIIGTKRGLFHPRGLLALLFPPRNDDRYYLPITQSCNINVED